MVVVPRDIRSMCFWNIHHTQVSTILLGSENIKYIYWYLSTDPDEPIQPALSLIENVSLCTLYML